MLTLEVLQLRTFRVVSYLDNGMLLRCGMSLFSKFLQTELKIHEFEPYPYLLKSPHTECALFYVLHNMTTCGMCWNPLGGRSTKSPWRYWKRLEMS